jgi:hypothetical protein
VGKSLSPAFKVLKITYQAFKTFQIHTEAGKEILIKNLQISEIFHPQFQNNIKNIKEKTLKNVHSVTLSLLIKLF